MPLKTFGLKARHCPLILVLLIKSSHLAKPEVRKVERILLSCGEESMVNKFGSARAAIKNTTDWELEQQEFIVS